MKTNDIILGIALGLAIYFISKVLILIIKNRKPIISFIKELPAAAAYAIRS